MVSNSVTIQMQKRCCSMWCWAAVLSTAVESCSLACSAQTQPDFANQFLAGSPDCSSCCPNGPPDHPTALRCDLGAVIEQAMSQFALSFSGGTDVDDSTFETICQQVDEGRPVIAKIDFDGSNGSHLLLIYGYSRPDTISFGDPADGSCTAVQFSTFRNPDAYTDPNTPTLHGTWNSTYVFDAV
jgi:hypothetical protein